MTVRAKLVMGSHQGDYWFLLLLLALPAGTLSILSGFHLAHFQVRGVPQPGTANECSPGGAKLVKVPGV
jgi:hypothetical protein